MSAVLQLIAPESANVEVRPRLTPEDRAEIRQNYMRLYFARVAENRRFLEYISAGQKARGGACVNYRLDPTEVRIYGTRFTGAPFAYSAFFKTRGDRKPSLWEPLYYHDPEVPSYDPQRVPVFEPEFRNRRSFVHDVPAIKRAIALRQLNAIPLPLYADNPHPIVQAMMNRRAQFLQKQKDFLDVESVFVKQHYMQPPRDTELHGAYLERSVNTGGSSQMQFHIEADNSISSCERRSLRPEIHSSVYREISDNDISAAIHRAEAESRFEKSGPAYTLLKAGWNAPWVDRDRNWDHTQAELDAYKANTNNGVRNCVRRDGKWVFAGRKYGDDHFQTINLVRRIKRKPRSEYDEQTSSPEDRETVELIPRGKEVDLVESSASEKMAPQDVCHSQQDGSAGYRSGEFYQKLQEAQKYARPKGKSEEEIDDSPRWTHGTRESSLSKCSHGVHIGNYCSWCNPIEIEPGRPIPFKEITLIVHPGKRTVFESQIENGGQFYVVKGKQPPVEISVLGYLYRSDSQVESAWDSYRKIVLLDRSGPMSVTLPEDISSQLPAGEIAGVKTSGPKYRGDTNTGIDIQDPCKPLDHSELNELASTIRGDSHYMTREEKLAALATVHKDDKALVLIKLDGITIREYAEQNDLDYEASRKGIQRRKSVAKSVIEHFCPEGTCLQNNCMQGGNTDGPCTHYLNKLPADQATTLFQTGGYYLFYKSGSRYVLMPLDASGDQEADEAFVDRYHQSLTDALRKNRGREPVT